MSQDATVFIVDDDASVRKALSRLFLSMHFRVEPCASASELLALDLQAAHGCILLDIQMPHVDGLELQVKLIEAGVGLPVIFLSGHADVSTTVTAMKAGAVDLITKPFNGTDLLDAVRRAIARDEVRLMAFQRHQDLRQRFETLTPREHAVFDLVVSGLRNKEVASTLGTSIKTVKVHRGRMMSKMQAPSLPELVRMANHLKPVGD
jgi:FixJ family two-component response regulator